MRAFIYLAAAGILSAPMAFAAGGGSMPVPFEAKQASPEERARESYNHGVRLVAKGDELLADAARQTDPRKKDKLTAKSRDAYKLARARFFKATELQPNMYEAWNYVGYTARKGGDYNSALTAYDRALALKPDYAQAIEYRAHAYLGLGRIADAQQAYMQLFSGNRALASQLLVAMQEWVAAHRNDGAVGGVSVESFANWVTERSSIASQTASLTREGAAASWR